MPLINSTPSILALLQMMQTRRITSSLRSMEYSRSIFENLIPLDGAFTEVWPGPNVTTEAGMKDFIKNEAWGHHASCTCPIGADNDPMAVLDSSFVSVGGQLAYCGRVCIPKDPVTFPPHSNLAAFASAINDIRGFSLIM